MLDKLKNTARHSLVYSIGNLSTKLIGFILLPLYTSYLSLADYGVLGILETTGVILVGIFSFKIPTAMQRWCAESESEGEQKKVVFISLLSLLIVVLSINLIIQPFTQQLSHMFFDSQQLGLYFKILLLSIGFEILNLLPLELLRFKEKSIVYISISSAKLATVLGLNIYFITVLNMGVEGILYSQLAGNGLLFLLALPFLLKNVRIGFSKEITRGMFKYGFPLVFTTISTLILTLSDRYILIYFHGYDDLGLYSLGYKIGSVINVFVFQSFAMGYLPIAYKMLNQEAFPRFYSKTLTYLSLALGVSILGLSSYSMELIKYLSNNPDYWMAYNLVPIIASVFLFKGIQYVFTLTFHFTKKTKKNIPIVLTGVVVNLILNFILIPKYSYYGAIIATIFALITMVYMVYRSSQKEMKTSFEIRKVTTIIIVTFILVGVIYYINQFDLSVRLATKWVIPFLLPITLIFLNFYEPIEVERIKGFVNKWKNPANWNKKIS